VIQRILRSLKRNGPKATLLKVYIALVDHWFDLRHGTDTCRWMLLGDLNIRSENKDRGVRYEPARIVLLRKMFAQIRELIPSGGAVVDLAPELCEIARKNCDLYRRSSGTTTELQILESDVVDYPISPDDNVFVMFNPFDDFVLNKVLDNMARSLAAHPRRIVIGYYSPEHSEAINRHPAFVREVDMSYWSYHFTLYSSVR
jgi:hypothetical protein